jgi:hypothetical protein
MDEGSGTVKRPAPPGGDVTPKVPVSEAWPLGISAKDLSAKEINQLLDRAIYRKDREQRGNIRRLAETVEELRKWVTMFCVILVLFLLTLLTILIKYRRW